MSGLQRDAIRSLTSLDARYVNLTGDTMTGLLVLSGDPSNVLGAATKQYVDAAVATVDTWAEVLALGNTSGATDAIITAGQKITVDTIAETTAASGITFSDQITVPNQVDAIKSGDYSLQFQSVLDEVGTPSAFPEVTADPNLISWWKFEEGTGTTIADEQGLSTATMVAATWVGSGAFTASTDSVAFDGTGDYCTLTDDYSFIQNTNVFTINAWIKQDNPNDGGVHVIFGNSGTSGEKGFAFFWEDRSAASMDRGIRMLCTNGTTAGLDARSGNAIITDTNWHMLTVTCDDVNTKFYVDGVAVTTAVDTIGTKSTGAATRNPEIGGLAPSGVIPWKGDLDNMAIYNTTESAATILGWYNTTQGVAGTAATSHIFDTSTTLVDSGTKLVSIRNNTVEKAYFDVNGALVSPDLTIDTTLLVTNSTANTVSITGALDSTSIDVGGTVVVVGTLDDDTFATATNTSIATSESIKAYVDAQVATVDTLAEILAIGNTSGGTNLIMSVGDTLTTDTITETGVGTGVTIESVLIKDNTVNIGTTIAIDSTLDDDTFATATATSVATSESIKAYTDTTVGAYLPLAGGTMTGAITIPDLAGAIQSGAHTGKFLSGATSSGGGTAPSQADAGVVSYWTFDDNGIFPQEASNANLVGWWKCLEGTGTTIADSSANNNTATMTGATWLGTGAFAESTDAIAFDGNNDYVTIPQTTDYNILTSSDSFSFSWSFRNSSASSYQMHVTKYDTSAYTNGLAVYDISGNFRVTRGGTGSIDNEYAYASARDGNWHEATVTYDGSGSRDGLLLYIDGVSIARTNNYSNNWTAGGNSTGPFLLGNRWDSFGDYAGDITNFAVYSEERTAEQILRDYDKTRTTIVADYVGTNHGTLTGATFATPGAFGYSGDETLSFDGANDKVTVASSTDFAFTKGSSFTVYSWIKIDAAGSGERMICGNGITTGTFKGWTLRVTSANVVRFAALQDGSNFIFTDSSALSDDTWYMVSVTYVDGTATMYIDGVLDNTPGSSGTLTSITPPSGTFTIGENSDGAWDFQGDLDNVIVYSDARSAAEILTDYNNAQPPSGNAWDFNTTSTIASSGTLMRWLNNDIETSKIDGAGNFFTPDLTIDTTLLVTNSTANTVSITGDTTLTGQLTTTGGRIKSVTRVTTTYTILVTDDVVLANTDSAGYTVTLPAGVEGQTFKIVNSGSSVNQLTLAPNGAEHLLGVNSNWPLNDRETLIITYNATDGWY